jgi:AcrR family transcriptional regulator
MISKTDIKRSAFRLFSEKGYFATSTADIADDLGLKKPSLYSHYKSKDEILKEILTDSFLLMKVSLEESVEALSRQSTEILMKGIFRTVVALFSDRDRLLFWKRTYFLQEFSDYKEILGDVEWDFENLIDRLLKPILAQRYPALGASTIYRQVFISYMLLIQGYLDWMLVNGYDEKEFQDAWTNFWNGTARYFT